MLIQEYSVYIVLL